MDTTRNIEIHTVGANDWIALYFRTAPDDAAACPADYKNLHGWQAVKIKGGKGKITLPGNRWFYSYETGGDSSNEINMKMFNQNGDLEFDGYYAIPDAGCQVIRVT